MQVGGINKTTSSLLIFKNSFQADALFSCGLRLWFLAISTVAQQAVLHQIWCFDTVWRISMFGYMTFF